MYFDEGKLPNDLYAKNTIYRISGIFWVDLIFAEFVNSLTLPKLDTVKNKPFHPSSLSLI